MKSFILVFVGSGLGGALRWALAIWIPVTVARPFPWATFTANLVACLLLGFFLGALDARLSLSPGARAFWMVGFCGGFSTFSTFSGELLKQWQAGSSVLAIAYLASSILACWLATAGGWWLGQRL